MTSPLCAASRANFSHPEGRTIIRLDKVISQSNSVLVDGSKGASANYYESWPFITYLTNNPDKYPGLGPDTLRQMIRQYHRGSNETPLHALQIVAKNTTVQKIVGRYWARMAYVDIGHAQGQKLFFQSRSRLNYNNLDKTGSDYRVKSTRTPKYMGSSIIPLKGSGQISAKITADMAFTATLAVKGANNVVRYVDLENGSGSTTVGAGEEATLVVANTPAKLHMYDAFAIGAETAKGMNFQVQLTGATA